jgi:hypothetical protein
MTNAKVPSINEPQTNLFGFLGFEEINLLAALNKCHHDLDVFAKIDAAFQVPISHITVDVRDIYRQTMLQLFLYVHGQMYFSVACLLRCHLSESLSSTRKAIDATLSAYRLIREPATLPLYHESHRSYQFIKRHIKTARATDESNYPLADPLLKVHDVCSQFGAHADISTFIHRIAVFKTEDPNRGFMTVGMFQIPESDAMLRRYVVETFLAFTGMLKVFAEFINGNAVDFDFAGWHAAIDGLGAACFSEAARLDAAIDAAQKGAE